MCMKPTTGIAGCCAQAASGHVAAAAPSVAKKSRRPISLPCDPPAVGHSCPGGMIPRFHRAVSDSHPPNFFSSAPRLSPSKWAGGGGGGFGGHGSIGPLIGSMRWASTVNDSTTHMDLGWPEPVGVMFDAHAQQRGTSRRCRQVYDLEGSQGQ